MFIFLDIESTGNENRDTSFEIVYITERHLIVNGYFNSHNIKGNKFADQLNELLQDSGNVLVAHNAQSKVSILEQKGIRPKRVICTLKLACFMDKLGKFPEDNLQYLRHRLDIEQEKTTVIDAFSNVFLVEKIFYELYHKLFIDSFPDGKEKMAITKIAIESSNESSVAT